MGGEVGEKDSASGNIARPSKVAERSYIESVVDYIHEVVAPQTSPKTDEKETVLWQSTQELRDGSVIMFIGYSSGLQCWILPPTGIAYEIFSHRKGQVKTASYLDTEEGKYSEELKKVHPFVLMVDSSSKPGTASTCVDIWSIRSGHKIHTIHFKSEIFSLTVNSSVIVVALREKIAVFDAITFESRFWISRCYPCTEIQPIGLGSRWLAYSDKGALQLHQSYGGMCGTGLQSYTATMLNAAESVKKGLSIVGETVGRLTQHNYYTDTTKSRDVDHKAGVVTIVDCIRADGETSLSDTSVSQATVAHFTAHTNSPIAAISFDRSGSLLVTADSVGKDFHVFQIKPHPWSSSVCQIHHLYILHRGDTSASIQNLAFSHDCRWLCASTKNGTTHVFPITPYGGPINCRTHLCQKVVNRHSRFHTSAGINHIAPTANGLSHEPEPLQSYQRHSTIPILPTPTVSTPLVQLKQSPPKSSNLTQTNITYPISAVFGRSRIKSPKSSKGTSRNESLFVLGPGAVLVEYKFECSVISGASAGDDAPIQLSATPTIQWGLARSTRSEEVLTFSDMQLLSPTTVDEASDDEVKKDDGWLSYVEIQSYETPHRCLWMGPQFCFRTVHVLPSSLNNASSSILADQTVVSEDGHHVDNIYDDMELHSVPLRTDSLSNSEAISGLCVIESGQGSVDQPSALEVNMSVDPCYKKDDLLLETITDAMQEVNVRGKPVELDDDMGVSQIIDIAMENS